MKKRKKQRSVKRLKEEQTNERKEGGIIHERRK